MRRVVYNNYSEINYFCRGKNIKQVPTSNVYESDYEMSIKAVAESRPRAGIPERGRAWGGIAYRGQNIY